MRFALTSLVRALVPALALVLTLVLTLAPSASARSKAAPAPKEDAGRLLNLAQQQLVRGEIEPAIASLQASLDLRGDDPFAWSLLAEALVWGRAQGVELVAAWEALAERRPGDGVARVRVLRAQMAAHRRDKFTTAEAEWVVEALGELEGLVSDPSPPTRYAALIARRDLRHRLGRADEALTDGLAAFALDPAPLQGRISRLQSLAQAGDHAAFLAACTPLLTTDPWAVEACSMLFGEDHWPDPTALEVARTAMRAAVVQLEERGRADRVLANEILKFHTRTRATADAARWLAESQSRWPDFVLLDHAEWYRGTFRVPPESSALYAGTNRAHNVEEPAARLRDLLALEGLVSADTTGATAQRWRWRVVEAALAQAEPDLVQARTRLLTIVGQDPQDARGFMELAGVSEGEEALAALLSAERAVLTGGWDPWERYGSLSFPEAMSRRGGFLGELRTRRAALLALLGRADEAFAVATDAALTAGDKLPRAFALLAHLAEARGQGALARDADVSFVAARLREGPEGSEPTGDGVPDAIRRVLAAQREIGREVPGPAQEDAAWATLVAAARERLDEGAQSAATASSEAHPLIGRAAPDLAIVDLGGAPRSFSELRGRVVVVDFWASWCAPCKRAMPELQAAADGFAGQPVTFLLVSVDAERALASAFMDAAAYTMDAVWAPDGRTTQREWVVRGIPSTFVVDAEGVVRHHHQGYARDAGLRIAEEVRALLP